MKVTSFLVWTVVGGAWSLALLGAASIGVFILPFAVGATIALQRARNIRPAHPGLVAGLGLPFLYVAWLNRAGPGTVCTSIRGGESCAEHMHPLPWLALGSGLFLTGIFLAVRAARRRVCEG